MKDSGWGKKKEEEDSRFLKERIDLRIRHEIVNIPKCLEGHQKGIHGVHGPGWQESELTQLHFLQCTKQGVRTEKNSR